MFSVDPELLQDTSLVHSGRQLMGGARQSGNITL